jgi:tetratricopeptide (TPR) repeat protein
MYFRTRLASDKVTAYIPICFWLAGCTILSTLSKENGVLLPLLAGILELTVLSGRVTQQPKLNRIWLTVFIGAPVIFVVGYLVYSVAVSGFFDVVPPRDFSIYERLLTESRVLVDYLQNWFIPKLYTTGIFQDHFIRSTGLFAPLSTLFCVLFHAVLLALAVAKRREWPLFSLAVLFFYGGHLLESTVLNLELYFEHRNYLSAAFLFLPLFAALSNKSERKIFISISVIVLCLLGGFTRYSSTVWKDYDSMVQASAHKAPTSARAQARLAAILFNAGHVDESLKVLDRALVTVSTGQPQLLGSRLIYMCHLGRLDAEEFGRVGTILAESAYDPRMINLYRELVIAIVEGNCPAVPAEMLKQVFESMLGVPPNDQPSSLGYSQLKYFIGYVSSYTGEPEVALRAFLESLDSRPGATSAMAMAALLAGNEHFDEALYLSDLALEQLESRGAATLRGAKVSESDIRVFQEAVHSDRAMKQDHDSGNRVD